jgi:L-lysine 2,3-aminomutase
MTSGLISKPKFYATENIHDIRQLLSFPRSLIHEMQVVGAVFPFRVNEYIVDELIDWTKVPDDPIFQLSFPQKGMLEPHHFDRISRLIHSGASKAALESVAMEIRSSLNPHPGDQWSGNVPAVNGKLQRGIQRKYRETALFFPAQGQTCYSYCTFCFRWAQFVGDRDQRFGSADTQELYYYLKQNRDLTDILFTGGDPMIMSSDVFSEYLKVLLSPELEHIQNVRIGTKVLAHWPQKILNGQDADDLCRILERLRDAGKHVTVMAHYDHWKELDTPTADRAVQRLQGAGLTIRSQGPLLAHINDSSEIWAKMWALQVRKGICPYYMFVERNTGPYRYFEVALERAHRIYADAMCQISGLGRTVRGPVMSASSGKIEVLGIAEIAKQKLFVLRFIQSRDPNASFHPFFAKYSPEATWIDQLEMIDQRSDQVNR